MRNDEHGERTLEATPHRLAEARRQGIVPRSPGLTASVAGLAAVAAMVLAGGGLVAAVVAMMRSMLAGAGDSGVPALGETISACLPVLGRMGMMAAAAVVAGMAAGLLQTGGLVAAEPLRPDWRKLARGGGSAGNKAWRLAVMVASLLAVTAVMAFDAREQLDKLALAAHGGVAAIVSAAGAVLTTAALRAAGALVVVGAVDYLVQRWLYQRAMRMTPREMKEEMKTTESGWRRRRNRQ